MVNRNGGSGNGEGRQEYDPEVEFEYIDSDVWIERSDGGEDVTYTQDVQKALGDDEESESSND